MPRTPRPYKAYRPRRWRYPPAWARIAQPRTRALLRCPRCSRTAWPEFRCARANRCSARRRCPAFLLSRPRESRTVKFSLQGFFEKYLCRSLQMILHSHPIPPTLELKKLNFILQDLIPSKFVYADSGFPWASTALPSISTGRLFHQVADHGGNSLIPVFSQERNQNLLMRFPRAQAHAFIAPERALPHLAQGIEEAAQ